ncbi:MAG: lysophospholipid acyltransferase family protein [Candidatus Methylomirabilia bacterium]
MTPRDRLLCALAPGMAYWAVRGLGLTLRVREIDTHHVVPFWEQELPLIYAIWHGRILMAPYLYSLYGPSRPIRIMASRSRDGELVARFMKRFGFQVVRGSTTEGGSEALRALARHLRQGKAVAVTPDGPQGPRYIVQPGVIALARLSGAPIIPFTFSAAPAWRLSSWDEFLIPRPFTRAIVSFGSPLTVPPRSDREEQEALRKELESSLRDLTWRADALLLAR